MKITEAVIIEGVKHQDRGILSYIYKEYFPLIEQLILENNGNQDDAKDVFQESVVVFYKDIKRGVKLNCSVRTYLYAVAKNHWLRNLKYKRVRNVTMIESYEELIDIPDIQIDKSSEYLLYQKHFKNLSEDCQKVLKYFFSKISLAEIAQLMGYQSSAYAKKRKHYCKERLVKSIKLDAEYEMHK